MGKRITFKACKCAVERGKLDVNRLPLDCAATWRLLASGLTVGVFQLERHLGREWSKKARPTNIHQLADLVALLRPGCLESGMTEEYCRVKAGEQEAEYIHPALKPILEETYGCLVYQEQAIRIAVEIAGFSLAEADNLRKGIGKKIPEVIAELRTKFIDKAAQKGLVTREQAEEIFGWIEKFQRYGFNRCIAGDTVICRHGRHGRRYHFSVEETYRIRNDLEYAKATGHEQLRRKWNRLKNYGHGLSLCPDGRIRPNVIRDIQPSGRRRVLRIVLDNGASIRTTDNHKFPTPNGTKRADALKAGDLLYVCGSHDRGNGRVRRAEKGHPSELVAITGIRADGAEETYDVTMDAPRHTFVTAGGIVTCNSHAVSYGMIAWQTAWLKCHFPCEFFASYLTFSRYKADPKEEVYKLVQDARLFDLTVLPPDVRRRNVHFEMTEDRKAIAFGLSHVRGVGQSAIEKIVAGADLDTWPRFLAAVPQFHRNVGEALIRSGACDGYGLSRNRMIRELEIVLGTTTRDETGKKQELRGMTAREREVFFERYDGSRSAAEVIAQMVKSARHPPPKSPSAMTKPEIIKRLVSLGSDEEALSGMKKADLVKALREHPDFEDPKSSRLRINEQRQAILLDKAKVLRVEQADTHLAKSAAEKHYLGVALSCSAVDDADRSTASHTCLDLARSPNGTAVRICAVIDGVRHTRTKRGNNPGQPMCFLNLSDSTYTVDHAVVFPDVYRRFKALCKEDFIVLIAGEKRDGSLIVGEIRKLL